MQSKRFRAVMALVLASLGLALGCKDKAKVSVERAAQHVVTLAETVKVDVEEVRRGLPEGAKTFVPVYRGRKPANVAPAPSASATPGGVPAPGASAAPAASSVAAASPRALSRPKPASSAVVAVPAASGSRAGAPAPAPSVPGAAGPATPEVTREIAPDATTVREALLRARDRVQDLRVAKSTFFALTDANGIVLRNDQEQDLMVTRPLFPSFPDLRKALGGKYVETRGSMPEAAGVRGRSDGQWIAAAPVMAEGRVRALYVTGWSWSAYAYRLETALRGIVRSELPPNSSEPLLYVFLIVGKDVFAAPVSPDVDIKAIAELDPVSKLQNEAVYSTLLTITNRVYGLAVKRTPVLGPSVAVAVLRSEV